MPAALNITEYHTLAGGQGNEKAQNNHGAYGETGLPPSLRESHHRNSTGGGRAAVVGPRLGGAAHREAVAEAEARIEQAVAGASVSQVAAFIGALGGIELDVKRKAPHSR